MNKRALKAIYDSYAPTYSTMIEKIGWWSPRVVEQFLKKHIKEKSIILDAACADGYASSPLHEEHEVYGFDFSDKMVEMARKSKMKEVICHDADNKFPYEDNTFDVGIGLAFFEFLRNINFTLSEFSRVVKSGGLIFVTVEDLDPSLEKQKTKSEDVVKGIKKFRYSRKEMLKIIKKQNFELLDDQRIFGYESKSLQGKYYYHYYLLRNS